MAKLIITRVSEWNNKAREFGIYLNNNKIGVISDGETKEFEIDSGKYKINGKIDWCKSPMLEFETVENESTKIEIAGFKYVNIVIPIALGFSLIYLLLKNLFEIDLKFLIVFTGIGFLFPLYYITFGKNKYLRIRETK
ncbi:hypothetical protein [Lutibacter sp. B1]|uniref:hypothetical protein n=1 Tax=Lutibacter sp. B1 TaxID=2725996 RepID=UPI0014567F0C|nr:hypothetical protein [Lutibacter sp. B1]NLP59388.1 hypothetical protein [Lutibacter sp. B1]